MIRKSKTKASAKGSIDRLAPLLLLLMISQSQPDGLATQKKDKQPVDSTSKTKPETKSIMLSPGIYDVPLVLSKSLEPRRKEFRQDFIDAQTRLRAFAGRYGWDHLTDAPFVKQVEIYDTKDGWDNRLREFYPKEAPKVIPKTFSAGIEHDIFFSVSPEVYLANYPDGRDEKDAFIKLMTHELAHRLHVRICKGDENKMGPMWFWEGFAVYAADQLNFNKPVLSDAEIWSIVGARDRGSYKKYNVVFRKFLKGKTLPQYVEEAGKPGFIESLKKQK